MPCRSYEDDYLQVASDTREQNNKLARIACSALNAFNEADPEACAKFLGKNHEAHTWWEGHKVADAAEKARVAKEKAEKKLAKAALAKLTPEERKALGL